ncbi:MAG: SDR family NAD(P)-dependent oxidoreductase [Actinobacteria bacterium]|nr:SDR family NAD(P)-dependent oxidoreductase [Actinomycetota bacterium]
MKDLKGKVVLVTGGARGMGLQHVLTFAGEGAKVIMTDIDGALLVKQSDDLKKKGYEVYPYVLDVSDRDACFKLAESIEKEVGPVDVLINNAGIVRGGDAVEAGEEHFRRMTDVNYLGEVWMVQAFVPSMKRRKSGHVVNVASLAGQFSSTGTAAYCASKHAVIGFSDSLRGDLARTGVSVSTICPNLVNTGMFDMDSKMAMRFGKIMGLEPEAVTAGVLNAVKKEKAEILLPRVLSHLSYALRAIFGPRVIQAIYGLPFVKESASTLGGDPTRPF